MTLKGAALVSTFALIVPAAHAQQIITFGDGQVIMDMGEGGMEMPSQEQPDATAKPAVKSTPRLEKLKKLDYDRRPSAMLAAWAKPRKPGDAPKTGAAEGQGGVGSTMEVAVAEDFAGASSGVVSRLRTLGYAGSIGSTVVVSGVAIPALPATPAITTTTAAPTSTLAGAVAPTASEPAAEAALSPEDAEKAQKAKDEAATAKKKAEDEAAAKVAEAKLIEEEMQVLQRNVTLGDWPAVKSYLAGLTEDERKGGYETMLQSLQQGPKKKPNVPQQGQQYLEKNRFSPADVLGLADAAGRKLEKTDLDKLGAILRQALDQGHQIDGFLNEIAARIGTEGFPFDRRQLALALAAANELVRMGAYLPTFEEAEKANDREGLNLLSRHDLAQYDTEKKVEWLVQAWRVTQSALGAGDVSEEAKDEALKRAVDIAPKIQKDLGQAWLDESFTARPERGMEILAAIGTSAAQALAAKPMDVDYRTKLLELQTTAAKALLAAAPERADEWARELTLLAHNWMREAQVTHQFDTATSLGPRMQRDNYGNFFYWDPEQQQFRGNQPQTIKIGKILEIRPGDDWLARVETTLRPKIGMVAAQLLLKVGEEAKAFPYIEQLAAGYPKPAKELVDEFLRVWARNHNPNPNQNQNRNQYIFFYGFEERANSIPLTRSKQERNLRELGEWLERLRKLPVEIDQSLVATAFTAAHGRAEVYRLETIESIFGEIDALEPKTLAALLESMRLNLANVWNDPAVQKDAKSNRGQQDIRAEVLRGYELGRATVEGAIAAQPGSWELVLVQGALQHDENDYRATLQKDSEFSGRRRDALATLARAADLYVSQVESLEQDKESTRAFETWFYAALGAVDLGAITNERQLASAEIPKIAASLRSIPGERGERHVAAFANTIFTRMGSAAPAVKYRYVREGLAIVGQHDLAAEAQKLYDYYQDLVTEIQLRATIDGSDRVGHDTPFGLRVDIRHTRAIERESGGFSKYLQNQNQGNFGYNYGRPLEDYRDKFEEVARVALNEHFEVLSVTFNEPNARSRADAEYGWRVTSYAYLLLKPRGAQIDRVPPLRLDLDFLDTSGYAVLPVESSIVPIDAREPVGEERPYEKLALTQTLDERQAKDGKLLVEVKAQAHGLVPALAELVDIAPAGFDVVKTDDHGVSVVKLEEEGATIASERTWTLQLRAKEGLTELPATFTFAEPKVETATNERFRYVDADLASVEPTVSLERQYGQASRAWIWWSAGLLVALVGGFFFLRRVAKPKAAPKSRFQVPETVTPFTVIGLLRDIQLNNGLAPDARQSLAGDIERIERHYFGDERVETPDLRSVAETWAGRAR